MNKKETGNKYEDIACGYLAHSGARIIGRNFRCREGEVDIICMDEGYLVFIEVKYRRSMKFGYAGEAVSHSKMKRICRVSDFYLLRYGFGTDTRCRYDVIAIDTDPEGFEHIRWHKNAFSYIPR